MYIRQTRTNNKATGEAYFTFRLVRGERIGGRVRQITVLNLGRHFAIKQDDWPTLCARLEQLLQPRQTAIFPVQCSDAVECAAQRYFGQLVERAALQEPASMGGTAAVPSAAPPTASLSPRPATPVAAPDFQTVDIDSLQQTQPRSVGVEHVALHALEQIGFNRKLLELGINGVTRAAILGNLIGRMAHPASERATWRWLQTTSALGELIDTDFGALSHMSLYRASDTLMKHRAAIEDHLFCSVRGLFALEETVTLYDLTNTYFEGAAASNTKAKHGRSKEKRSDCPIVTLGLVLDGSGFVKRSQTFAGNVSEGTALEVMLTGLGAPPGALVVMDAGIATAANLSWLVEHGFRYLVVRRGGARQFADEAAVSVETVGGQTLRIQNSKEERSDGHLFISVLAYQCVQILRTQLKAAGIHASWSCLRQTLSVQRRITASLRCADGRTVHVRKSTVAEPALKAIYDALKINAVPGGSKKLFC